LYATAVATLTEWLLLNGAVKRVEGRSTTITKIQLTLGLVESGFVTSGANVLQAWG